MAAGGGSGGNAERHGAIIDPPGRRDRGIAVGLEPAIAVGVGGKDRETVGEQRLHSRNRVFQDRRPLGVVRRERILAALVEHRHVQVHAIARAVGKRLGHEGRFKVVLVGARLDQPFVHDRIVAGAHRVGLVAQRQLELPRGIFRNRAFQRDALRVGPGIERVEERPLVVELGQPVNLDIRPRDAPRPGDPRKPVTTMLRLEQIKFQFDRDHRGQPDRGQPVDHPLQHHPRVEVVRAPVELVETGEKLRRIGPAPRRRHQRARHRPAMAIGIPRLPQQPGLLDIAPGNVGEGDRDRQEPPAFIDRQHFMLTKPLAARHPAHVGEDHVDRVDMRVCGKESAGFVDRGNGSGHNLSFSA